MSKSYLGQKNLTRGIRNNNPGNLIYTSIAWQGKIPKSKNTDTGQHFEQFIDIHHGIRAMLKDLINDIKKGKNTVRKLISEYAPPSENNTESYILHVAKSLKVSADTKLTVIDSSFLLTLAKAIIQKECAPNHNLITDEDIIKSIGMLGDVSDSKLTVKVETNSILKRLGLTGIFALTLFFFF